MIKNLFACMLLASSGLTFAQQSGAPIPSAVLPTPTPGQVVEQKPTVIPAAPQLAATGFILVDATTGNIVAESNSEERLPPASLTKMMTSYLVVDEIEKGRITEDAMVNISVKAWKMGGSRMYIREGTQVSVIDLLRGVIIQSGNDASVALAEYVSGNEDAFVDLMNQKAAQLGMTNTHFENSTGWPADGHLTTAKDLAVLARAIINDHPSHYPLYAEKYFFYNNIRQPNRNLLLNRDETVDGLKTGHTEEAGYCLVASSKRENTRFIAVVMGTASESARAAETQKLLAYGFRYFQTTPLYQAGQQVSTARVWAGTTQEVTLGIPNNIVLTLPKGREQSLQANMHVNEIIKAPIAVGQELGNLTVELDGQLLVNTPIVALQAVEEAGFFARLLDNLKLFFRNLFS
ncbi:D-alanyl-D-alanine carboxypeptidase family protein [Cellvibrio sp. OA-2007]|uniref:D-alanyl-D-alanine carboxypeptidase family protein n=1 Tax=Cellvibrio sp. OA-2007 TaxID=529823 RepID=UPI0007823650|nr:D-alanyl-D-alanine carboxypeptidase family protein [Cellvibrio sp. OA-2007]